MGILLLAGTMTFIAPWMLLALLAERSEGWRRFAVWGGFAVAVVAVALLGVDDEVAARSLFIVSIGAIGIGHEFRPTNRYPSFLVLIPTAQMMATAAHLALMDAEPDLFPPFWQSCRRLDTLETVQWMILLGIVAYEGGRAAIELSAANALGRLRSSGRALFDDLGSHPVTLDVVAGIGVAIFALVTSIRGFGYLTARSLPQEIQGILGSLDFFFYLGLYAAVAATIRRGWRRAWVTAWVVLVLLYEIFSGSKGRFAIYVLLPIGMIFLIVRPRPSFGFSVAAIILFFVSWLVVYPTLVEYRSSLVTTDFENVDRMELMTSARSRASQTYAETVFIPIFESQLTEQVLAMTSIVSFDVRRSPEHLPVRLLFFWVPRAIWPEKPEMLNANEVGRASHRVGQHDLSTSVLMTSIGELYVYLGMWGASLMTLMGVVVAGVVPVLRTHRDASDLEVGFVAFLARFLPGLVSGAFESGITGFLIEAIASVAVLVALRVLARRVPTARLGSMRSAS